MWLYWTTYINIKFRTSDYFSNNLNSRRNPKYRIVTVHSNLAWILFNNQISISSFTDFSTLTQMYSSSFSDWIKKTTKLNPLWNICEITRMALWPCSSSTVDFAHKYEYSMRSYDWKHKTVSILHEKIKHTLWCI